MRDHNRMEMYIAMPPDAKLVFHWKYQTGLAYKGVRKGWVLGLKPPPLSLLFYKIFVIRRVYRA